MAVAPRATTSATVQPYVVPPSQKFDGNDGSWSSFKVSAGTPGQDFRVLPSTNSGEMYLIVPEGCLAGDGADCPNQRGAEVFDSEQSPGFQVNASSTWSTIGQYDVDLEERLDYAAQGIFGYDRIALGPASSTSSLSLDHQVIGGVAELDYYMGSIPLGVTASSFSSLSQSIDSFMVQLRNQTKIPSLSFSYTAGAKYRLKSVFGSLILGGYDSTRFTPNSNPFSFSLSTDPSKLLTVGVAAITAINTLAGTYSLSSSAHFSLVDSTVPHLWLPQDICDNFEKAFGLTYDNATDLYLVNSTIHTKLKSLNPSITVKLVNSLSDTTTNYTNIVLPYAAFDLQASYPYYPNATNYFPIRRAANDTQYTLGRTLLQEAYLIVDYERANFTIAQAAFPDPLPAAKIVSITSFSNSTKHGSDSKSSSPLSPGAIAGIAIGGVVLVVILVLGIVLFLRKRKQSHEKYELANTQFSEAGSSAAVHAQKGTNNQNAQELSGTAVNELATPYNPYHDHKTYLSPQPEPQELPTPMHSPGTRRETRFHEMEGESLPSSQAVSRSASQDGRNTRNTGLSSVSPVTPGFR